MEFVAGPDIVQNLHDEKGDEQYPQDGDLVRRGHALQAVLAEAAKSQSSAAIFGWTEQLS